jgi:hypothetical protein
MAKKSTVITLIICAAILLAIIIGLIAGAFEVVEVLKFGILIDAAKINITNEENYLYLSGRYHAGLGNNFKKLPSKRITLALADNYSITKSADYSEGSITTRTIEGISLTTTVTCQVRLIDVEKIESEDESVKKEYNKTFLKTVVKLNLFDSSTYKPILATIMKSTLLDVISTYKLTDVYSKRYVVVI